MKHVVLAFDAQTKRWKDENGFLHVESSHITKEQVSPYYGFEIPDFERFNLIPNKIYYAFRCGKELQKGLKTFNGLPLTLHHHVESADEPQKEYRVGSLGTSATWNEPFVDNALTITDQVGIEAIESGRCREISMAYQYDPDFTPGEYEGTPYDFVMRNIRGNHAALVEEGRAGPQVVVADTQMKNVPLTQEGLIKMWKNFLKGAYDSIVSREENVLQDSDEAQQIKTLVDKLGKDYGPSEVKNFLTALTNPKEDLKDEKKEELTEPKVKEDAEDDTPEEDFDPTANDEDEFNETSEDEDLEEDDLEEDEDINEEDLEEDEDIDDFNDTSEDEEPDIDPNETTEDELEEEAMDALKIKGYDSDESVKDAFKVGFKFGKGKAEDDDVQSLKEEMSNMKKKFASDTAMMEKRIQKEMGSRFKAADEVSSVVGKLNPLAFDSAKHIYVHALEYMGVPKKSYNANSACDMFRVIKKQRNLQTAQDSPSHPPAFEGPFAGLNNIK